MRPEAVPGCKREHFADPLGCSSPSHSLPAWILAPAALPAACKTRALRSRKEWEWERKPEEEAEAQRRQRGQPAGLRQGWGRHCEWGAVAGLRGRAGVMRSDALTWARSLGVCSSGPRPPPPPHCQALTAPLCSPGGGHIFFPLKNNTKNASFNFPIFLTVLFMKCSFENAILMPSS